MTKNETRGFPARWIAVLIGLAAIGSAGLVARSKAEFGALIALTVASLAAGSLAGFLVGAPGMAKGGEDGANEKGWSNRLGVFGNWVTGAAIALGTTNASKISSWLANLTNEVSKSAPPNHNDALLRYTLGALMIAAAAMGFAVAFLQMVTNGRLLIERAAANAEKAATNAEKAATNAERAAAKAEKAAALIADP